MYRRWKALGLLMAAAPWMFVVAGFASPRAPRSTPVSAFLPIWRKPDERGRACVSCHSPDGLEIAAYAFSDEDILRRARAHLSEGDANQIVDMIHSLRSQYHLDHLLDPMADRPMQPGGALLSGATALERDATFARTLPALVPLFFAGRIDSAAKARAARDQIMAVDLDRLKVGIPINRLSEDVFHGDEHATIADWLPDVPLAKELPFDVQDAYLADPSEKGYRKLDAALVAMSAQQGTFAQSCALEKRRSLLYFEQQLRAKLAGSTDKVPPPTPNPMWNLAELARFHRNAALATLGMPKDILDKKLSGPSAAEQLRDMRLGWYWLGWCGDPGLQKISGLAESKRADYFSRFLWSDGPYPTHLAFMITRKLADEAYRSGEWGGAPPQHLDLDYSFFVSDDGIGGPLPTAPEHRKLFDSFVANSFRMNLYLQMEEVRQTKLVYLKLALIQQIHRMKKFFTDAKDQTLADQALALIDRCHEVRD